MSQSFQLTRLIKHIINSAAAYYGLLSTAQMGNQGSDPSLVKHLQF